MQNKLRYSDDQWISIFDSKFEYYITLINATFSVVMFSLLRIIIHFLNQNCTDCSSWFKWLIAKCLLSIEVLKFIMSFNF